jgi:large subunit ribosomal protein L18e
MPKRTGPTNEMMSKLISDFEEQGRAKENKLFLRIAKELKKATRNRREVGLARINRNIKDGETIIVPGKILDGKVDKKLEIFAWSSSKTAKERVVKNGGNIYDISGLLKNVPKKSRIMG